jgi:predicted phosphate transport protein (TIGR00153 family)
MEKRSYEWFEKRRRTKGLDIAYEQMIKAVETVALLHRAVKSFSEGNMAVAEQDIENLFKTEEEVDKLRTEVFRELSKGAALIADYREDLLHLVKRLDTVADHTKDAARCLKMLAEAQIPNELCEKAVSMTASLEECARALQESIEKISPNPTEALSSAEKVGKIEHQIDEEYLTTKALFIKYGTQINCGSMVIFDDLIEFIEQAADLCADTADYVIVLASRE